MFDYSNLNGYASTVPYYSPRPYQPQPISQPLTLAPQTLIKVNGRAGAEAYQINAPNSVVALFDANEDIFYIKRTDGANYPSIEAYSFSLATQPAAAVPADFVTRKEFEELKEMIINGKQSVRRGKQTSIPEPPEE